MSKLERSIDKTAKIETRDTCMTTTLIKNTYFTYNFRKLSIKIIELSTCAPRERLDAIEFVNTDNIFNLPCSVFISLNEKFTV